MFEDVAQFIKVFEDACFRKGIDWKVHGRSAFNRKRLSREIDRDAGAGFQQRMRAGIDNDGQQTILQRILAEDIRKTRRDDSSEAVIRQCPNRMLARAATAEVVSGNENLGSGRRKEIGPVGKKMPSHTDLVRRL